MVVILLPVDCRLTGRLGIGSSSSSSEDKVRSITGSAGRLLADLDEVDAAVEGSRDVNDGVG